MNLLPQKSQTDEFNELLRVYGDMAYRMAFQLTGGRAADAGDLVQEVFLKIWRNWKGPRPTSMKGWMYRVLHNLHVDGIRRRARANTLSLDATPATTVPWDDILPDRQPLPDQTLEQKETQTRVSAALAQLDEDYRMPIVLCDIEGLPYEDIARILQCPVGTVRSRIHRGRSHLRRLLQPHMNEVPS